MGKDKERILELLEKGEITAEEAARLLDCIQEETEREKPQPRAQSNAGQTKGKKLRIEVKGDTQDVKKVNVNVSVPLVLARYADQIIANCVPKSVGDELRTQGIDLSMLKLGELVDTIETIEEDIVNADILQDDIDMKVRIYVE